MDNKELTLERVFDAPRDRVFEAWTDPTVVAQWWGPSGVTNPTCEWDAQPGGKIYIVMLAGQELGDLAGQEWPMSGTFQEVVPAEKLVFTSSALLNGKPIIDAETTVTFETTGSQTKVTVHVVVTKSTPEAASSLAGMEMGWNQQLDKLVDLVRQQS